MLFALSGVWICGPADSIAVGEERLRFAIAFLTTLFVVVCFFGAQSFFPAMTKIVGTLGPKSRSVEVISGCLKAGMSGN